MPKSNIDNSLVKVFVVGPYYQAYVEDIFIRRSHQYRIVSNASDADIIVFTGGDDISPGLYGEKPLPATFPDLSRDAAELKIIKQHLGSKTFVGICRGAQLLNCIPENGGRMWQNVSGHGGSVHIITDTLTNTTTAVNSIHHQMMIPGESALLLAYSSVSGTKERDGETWYRDPTKETAWDKDPEVLWYESTRCLCFQAHPEFGHSPTTSYFFDLMTDVVLEDIYHETDSIKKGTR